jgi:hypothetical protein
MAKYKYILTVIITLCAITTYAQPAQYTPMTAAGYQMKRLKVDSTLHLPSFCGVPTIRGSLAKEGALAIDTCGGFLYMWTRAAGWDTVNTSGGGGGSSTDTTSLSNRINQRIDSLRRRSDSVFARKNGVFVFQYKDSVGGGGTTPTLQQVTDSGSTTTNTIIVGDISSTYIGIDPNQFQVGNGTESISITSNKITSTTSSGQIDDFNLPTSIPANLATIPISVNGIKANANGNITISTSGVAVDTIFRTLGKDSIFYKKNNITYAIKDSVGTNPAPVGYYGAFQDTTTQTAASINTAYGVKLGVTDLSNGVTISNNTRIKIANAGIYNIQFSLQLQKTGGSGNMIADIWLRKNGVNLDGTTGKVVLTGSANASPVVAAWNYVIAISSGDSLELMWATSNTNVEIVAAVATAPHPSIPSAILTVTQQSGIMAGTGISPLDTANMLLPYLRKIDTLSLSNRINLKLNISDTSAFQRKSISSYTFLANNTPATANVQALPFKDTSGTYTGTITWNGTAPTSGNFTYRWTRIGRVVTINIVLAYANIGTGNSQVVVTLPTDAPTPTKPSGLTAASNLLYPLVAQINNAATTLSNSVTRGMMRSNSANGNFEFLINSSALTASHCYITCTYFTD